MRTKAERKQISKGLEQRRRLRVDNLRKLAELYDSMRQFAFALGQDPSFIHALCGPNPRRNVGDELARSIEYALKLAPGWLDEKHG